MDEGGQRWEGQKHIVVPLQGLWTPGHRAFLLSPFSLIIGNRLYSASMTLLQVSVGKQLLVKGKMGPGRNTQENPWGKVYTTPKGYTVNSL